MRRLRSDDGSILPLVIGFGALALVVVLLVAAAASLYLERKRLFTVADGAALVGAEAFALDEVSRTPLGPRPTLTSAQVASAVDAYLATAPTGELEALAVERAVTLDGRSATVRLSAYWRPPVLSLLVPKGFRLEVTAVGRSVFG